MHGRENTGQYTVVKIAESVDRILEHFLLKDRAAIVDPQIKALAKATRVMFRAQRKSVLAFVRPALDHLTEADNQTKVPTIIGAAMLTGLSTAKTDAWLRAHRKTTTAAYTGAAGLVAASLDRDLPDTLSGPAEAAAALKSIEATTLDRLHTALEDAYAKIQSSDKSGQLEKASVISAIDEVFDEAEGTRADTIALTEIAEAFGSGQSDAADAISLDTGDDVQKEWVTEPDACEVCEENEAAGPIDLEDVFPSGDDDPPAHPNCRCTLEMTRKGESLG